MDKSRKRKMQNNILTAGWLSLRVMALVAALLAGTAALGSAQVGGGGGGGEIPQTAVSSTYQLAPYDVIDISVYNEEDLHTRTRLGADGTALLPLIGTVSLGGKTVSEANDLIRDKYSKGFVKDPHVLLTVLEYRKSTFSILGQVEKPGIYEIPEGTHMSIVDAILLGGGFTRLASQNDVTVKRMVHGKPTVIKVKAGSMADSSDVAPFEILPGDVIKVKESWW
jgi:protein involved in polysaccharide export with SLBB domain